MVHNPILLLLSIVVAAAVLVAGAAVAYALLQTAGTYETGVCKHPVSGAERTVETSEPFARSFDVTWSGLVPGVQVTLTENEVTSRAGELLGDDFPVDEITICFHDGYAEAFAHGSLPGVGSIPVLGGLFDSSVRARGTLDFSGPVAVFTLSELDIDNVPGFLEDPLRDEIERETNEALATLPLGHGYSLTFREGAVDVSVAP